MFHKSLSPNLIKDVFMLTWQGPEWGLSSSSRLPRTVRAVGHSVSDRATTTAFAFLSALFPQAACVQAKV